MAIGSILDVLFQLEDLGFFIYILPFLLMFAIVWGILEYTKIFGENGKASRVVVALVLGLLSIRLDFYSNFLTEISPRLAVGLTILVAAIILIGMFIPNESVSTVAWILFALGGLIFIIIAVQTFNALSYFGMAGSFDTSQLIGWVVMIAILIGVIVAIVSGGHTDPHHKSSYLSRLFEGPPPTNK